LEVTRLMVDRASNVFRHVAQHHRLRYWITVEERLLALTICRRPYDRLVPLVNASNQPLADRSFSSGISRGVRGSRLPVKNLR